MSADSKTNLATNSAFTSETVDNNHYGSLISVLDCSADEASWQLKCTIKVDRTFDWASKVSRFNKDRMSPTSISYIFKFKAEGEADFTEMPTTVGIVFPETVAAPTYVSHTIS